MTDPVLPGFEQEVADIAAARAALNEAHRIAASDPSVSGPDKDGRYTLTRTHPYVDVDGVGHRAVTAILTPAEWTVLENHILADLGLTRATHP